VLELTSYKQTNKQKQTRWIKWLKGLAHCTEYLMINFSNFLMKTRKTETYKETRSHLTLWQNDTLLSNSCQSVVNDRPRCYMKHRHNTKKMTEVLFWKLFDNVVSRSPNVLVWCLTRQSWAMRNDVMMDWVIQSSSSSVWLMTDLDRGWPHCWTLCHSPDS